MTRFRLSIIQCALLASSVVAGAAPPPEHVDAYLLVIKAEQAEKEGRISDAVSLFDQSAARFIDVTEAHPDWQPELVRYRITHSENQAARLRALLRVIDRTASNAVPDSLVEESGASIPAESKVEPAAIDTRDEEIRILEDGLQKLERENLELQNRIDEATEQIDGLTRRTEALLANQSVLSNTVSSLSTELEEKRAALEQQQLALGESGVIRQQYEALQQTLGAVEEQTGNLAAVNQQQQAELDQLKLQEAEHLAAIARRDDVIRQMETDAAGRLSALQAELDATAAKTRQFENQLEQIRNEKQALEATVAESASGAESRAAMARQIEALTNELESVRKNAARVNLEFESAVRLNQEYDRARRELEAERNRLLAEVQDGVQGFGGDKSDRASALQVRIDALVSDNDQLKREIDGLNHTIEKIQQKNATAKLRAQNSALLEENRVMRAHITKMENQLREIERNASGESGSIRTP